MDDNKNQVQHSKFSIWLSQWTKFNFPAFLKDFNLTGFYWILGLVAAFILFEIPIKKLLNSILIDPIVSFCPESAGADLVFGLLLIISIAFFVRQVRKHIIPTINSVIFSIAILVIYFLFFKTDGSYKFYHYTISFLDGFTYLTSFIFSVLFIVVTYKSYLKSLTKKLTKFTLLDDYPSTSKYTDLYGRAGYAGSVATHISATSSEVSFAIGIIGDWGSGKSDFMLRLEDVLKDNTENILCDFNPWRVNKPDAIIEEFFRTLSKHLEPYNQSISSTLNDYSNRVLKTARETQFKFIDALIGSWFRDEDIQEKYDTINEAIKATSKRIIVFIDDVDRLTGKEVMEVLRIIRNTANFANTFFIVGIDQNYIINVLKNTKDFANEEEYLKKVFQLTITLPAFKKDVFVNEMKKILYTPDLEEHYRKRINFSLSQISIDTKDADYDWSQYIHYASLLEKMIDNVRDLKRFCNSFKIVFNILKDEAEISDLIVLELIRNKNILVYNNIRNRKILMNNRDSPDMLLLDGNEWKKLQDQLPEYERPAFAHALEFLFTENQYKNQKKLILAHNFYIYFSYQLFNLISFHEFNQTLEKKEDEIISVFKWWINQGKGKELSQIFMYIDDFNNENELKKIVTVLLRLWYLGSDWFEHAKKLVFDNWKYNHGRYFKKDKLKHKDFLCSILNDVSIDLITRAHIANLFLKPVIDGIIKESELFISLKELRRIIYHLFDQYLQSNPNTPQKSEEFYHLNASKVIDGKVQVFSPVNRLYKKYLLSNQQGFENYVRVLLRPSHGQFVIDTYIEQIFPDLNVFANKLSSTIFKDPDMNKLKGIILSYFKNYLKSGRTPINIQNVKDKIFIEKFLLIK